MSSPTRTNAPRLIPLTGRQLNLLLYAIEPSPTEASGQASELAGVIAALRAAAPL